MFLSDIAKSVKESGSDSGEYRFLLKTEKSALSHKFTMIAEIVNLGAAYANTIPRERIYRLLG